MYSDVDDEVLEGKSWYSKQPMHLSRMKPFSFMQYSLQVCKMHQVNGNAFFSDVFNLLKVENYVNGNMK